MKHHHISVHSKYMLYVEEKIGGKMKDDTYLMRRGLTGGHIFPLNLPRFLHTSLHHIQVQGEFLNEL